LKPENILCDGDVTSVVIADFGIAHFRSDVLLAAVETGNQEADGKFCIRRP
jgi:serine/threonine protein kinase